VHLWEQIAAVLFMLQNHLGACEVDACGETKLEGKYSLEAKTVSKGLWRFCVFHVL